LKHVSYLVVILITTLNVLTVSAQQKAPDTSLSLNYNDSVNNKDSQIVTQYVQLSDYYLDVNPDSSVYWAEKILAYAQIKNNWLYQQYGLQALQRAGSSILKKHTSENKATLNRFSKLEQKITTLTIATIIFLLCCAFFFILYLRKIKSTRILEVDKTELAERLKNFQSDANEFQQKNLRLQNENQELQTNYINLVKLNEIKDKLIPMIAHDIRSPLATLQNTLALTRDNIINPEEFQQLGAALESDVFNLRGMLDNMLLWAREQMFEIKVNKVKLDLSETFKEIILMYRNSLVVKNITLHNYMPPSLMVTTDKEIVSAIFRNLFSNAVKFTERGKSIYINQIFFDGKAYISIKDEGKGIPDDVLQKLKNKQHVTTRDTANEKETGLGLLFSKEMVNKLNENFDITSYPEYGTSVTFSISMN